MQLAFGSWTMPLTGFQAWRSIKETAGARAKLTTAMLARAQKGRLHQHQHIFASF